MSVAGEREEKYPHPSKAKAAAPATAGGNEGPIEPSATASTVQYLEQHHLHQILEYLCAQLVYAKPADPKAFLASELRKLQSKRGADGIVPTSALTLFSDTDFEVMFRMMDPVNKGTLTAKQVHKAISDLGLDANKTKVDPTVDANYNIETFKKVCQEAL
jgi:hypothetical protein